MQASLPQSNAAAFPYSRFRSGYLGPAIMMLAFGQATGELIHWPYLVVRYDLFFMFLLIPACILQFPMFSFLARHSVLTGESFFSSLLKCQPILAGATWLVFLLTTMWISSYTAAGGTAIVKLLNAVGGMTLDTATWANRLALLLNGVFFVVLVAARKETRGIISLFMRTIAVLSMIVVSSLFFWSIVAEGWRPDFFVSLVSWKFQLPDGWSAADAKFLLTAFIFAGVGGLWNVIYSNWVVAERQGMAVSQVSDFIDYRDRFPVIDAGADSRSNYSRTMRLLHTDLLVGTLSNLAMMIMLVYVVYVSYPAERDAPTGLGMVTILADALSYKGHLIGAVFYVFVALFLIDTWMAAADALSKIHSNVAIGIVSRLGFSPAVLLKYPKLLYLVWLVFMLLMTVASSFVSQPQQLLYLNGVLSGLGSAMLVVCLLVTEYKIRGVYSSFPASRWMLVFLIVALLVYSAAGVAYVAGSQ